MTTFEIGNKYSTHSVCNHDCIMTIEITGRTAKTVTFIYDGESRRSKIRVSDSGEYIIPDNYSMAPVFRAERLVQLEEAEAVEAESEIIIVSQFVDDTFINQGQRVERDCGACFATTGGTIIDFIEVPDGKYFRGGVHAVISWDDDSSDFTEKVLLSNIHSKGWQSANGSQIGIYLL